MNGLPHITAAESPLELVDDIEKEAGKSELRIPGVHPTEALRPPVLAERALRGADLARTDLAYLLDRSVRSALTGQKIANLKI